MGGSHKGHRRDVIVGQILIREFEVEILRLVGANSSWLGWKWAVDSFHFRKLLKERQSSEVRVEAIRCQKVRASWTRRHREGRLGCLPRAWAQ